MEDGRFRKDLFWRLNVFPIHLPPLRDRLEDIPYLVECFMGQRVDLDEIEGCLIEPEALDKLQSYSWPGNVRELENVIERALVLSKDGQVNLGTVKMAFEMDYTASGNDPSSAVPVNAFDKKVATMRGVMQDAEDVLKKRKLTNKEKKQLRGQLKNGNAIALKIYLNAEEQYEKLAMNWRRYFPRRETVRDVLAALETALDKQGTCKNLQALAETVEEETVDRTLRSGSASKRKRELVNLLAGWKPLIDLVLKEDKGRYGNVKDCIEDLIGQAKNHREN